jgi:hypothetical protein
MQMTLVGTIAVLALALAAPACGGGSATSGKVSGASTHHKNTAGCLVGAANCNSDSAACKAAERTIQQALGKTAKPTVEIVSGVSAITSKKEIARDRHTIRRVIAQVTALRSTYLACPNHDPNLDANIAALKSYLH